MKMWIRKGILGTFVLGCILAAAGAASAQAARRADRGVRFWDRPEIREGLALTDEQIERLKAQHYESAKAMTALRSRIQVQELDLENLLDSTEPDEEAVRAMAREIGALRAELYQNRVAHRLELKRILTPEQEQKLREIRVRAARARRERPDRARQPRANRDNARREPREERNPRERRPL
jgi:Spy/CpxP family protein refolding chaperone